MSKHFTWKDREQVVSGLQRIAAGFTMAMGFADVKLDTLPSDIRAALEWLAEERLASNLQKHERRTALANIAPNKREEVVPHGRTPEKASSAT